MKRNSRKPNPSRKKKNAHSARKTNSKQRGAIKTSARGDLFGAIGNNRKRGPKKADARTVSSQGKKKTDRKPQPTFEPKANTKRRTVKRRLRRYSALKNPRQTLAHQKALAAIQAGVELGPVGQPARVMHLDGVARLDGRSIALFQILVLQAGTGGDHDCLFDRQRDLNMGMG